MPWRRPDREDHVRTYAGAEAATRAGRGVGDGYRVVAEDVDAGAVKGKYGLRAGGNAQLAALAMILRDDDRPPR